MDPTALLGLLGTVAGVVGVYYARAALSNSHEQRSRDAFLHTHSVLRRDRIALEARAAQLHLAADPTLQRVGGTDMLTRADLLLQTPIPLTDVKLEWATQAPGTTPGIARAAAKTLPKQAAGSRFRRFSHALEELARPALLSDRPSYRLQSANWTAQPPRLTFGPCTYFEMLDVSMPLAHELARERRRQPGWRELPLRAHFRRDILALDRRVLLPGIATLTLRKHRHGPATFLLHWRDPSNVAQGGGVFEVVPAGVFQPALDSPLSERDDLNLWRSLMREFAEEILGMEEAEGGPGDEIDYRATEPYRTLQRGLNSHRLHVSYFGFGVEPLGLVSAFMTAAVFEPSFFDQAFPHVVHDNAEGILQVGTRTRTGVTGLPFTEDKVREILHGGRVAPAAAACLHLAWEHRAQLLG